MKTDLITFSCERLIISLLSSCQNREHHVLGILGGKKNQETVGGFSNINHVYMTRFFSVQCEHMKNKMKRA